MAIESFVELSAQRHSEPVLRTEVEILQNADVLVLLRIFCAPLSKRLLNGEHHSAYQGPQRERWKAAQL